MPTDPLDRLLEVSAPSVTPDSPALADQLHHMVPEASEPAAARRPSRPRPSRTAIAGLTSALVVVGAGSAAAGGVWSPWAQDPDTTVTYTLPSGATCEMRLGDVQDADPAMTAAIQDYLADVDLESVIDVDAQISALRADRDVFVVADDGSMTPAWYGTPDYKSPDEEYNLAHSMAITEAVTDELERQGFDTPAGFSYAGEAQCPGAQW